MSPSLRRCNNPNAGSDGELCDLWPGHDGPHVNEAEGTEWGDSSFGEPPQPQGEEGGSPNDFAVTNELRAADEAASVAHDYIWGNNGVTQQQASDAIWTIHNALRPLFDDDPEPGYPRDAVRPIPCDGLPVPTPYSAEPRDRVAVCGCVWRHSPGATQGWKWKCVKRCPEHDSSAGYVVPQGPTS